MAAEAVSPSEFQVLIEDCCPGIASKTAIAVGLSGGPDSLYLARALSDYAARHHPALNIHALTVDHGLREASGSEARAVAAMTKDWPSLTHIILPWEGKKPATRLQEAARNARYRLLGDYCRSHAIKYLCLAHHQDDQIETFLLRLAKGSGLDGLGAMKPRFKHKNGLIIVRPLLDIPKARLIASCAQAGLSPVEDPGNASDRFFRGRLRRLLPFLEQEGFSAKRLAITSRRLARAQNALDRIAEGTYFKLLKSHTENKLTYDCSALSQWPEEIGLRVLIKAIHSVRKEANYPPRREKIENLYEDLIRPAPFRKRTLGGLIFERNDIRNLVIIRSEANQAENDAKPCL